MGLESCVGGGCYALCFVPRLNFETSAWNQKISLIPYLNINEKGLHKQAFLLRADDGIRTHDINLGKVALYH